MPEGDTIYRTAAQLRRVLEGRTVSAARGRWEVEDAATLAERRCDSIETRGKHLLMHFDDQRVLHSHMGMTGSWHIYRRGEPWRKSQKAAAIVLDLEDFVVVCFSPKLLELVSSVQLKGNNYLRRLGPDLLGSSLDRDEIVARFRTQDRVSIGQAVMNQTVVCGIGNVYKSEVLFLETIHPLTPVRDLTDHQIWSLVERSEQLMRRNLEGYPRRTRFLPGEKLWVYDRSGDPCLKCGTRVEMIRQGDLGRSTYFCPECQTRTA